MTRLHTCLHLRPSESSTVSLELFSNIRSEINSSPMTMKKTAAARTRKNLGRTGLVRVHGESEAGLCGGRGNGGLEEGLDEGLGGGPWRFALFEKQRRGSIGRDPAVRSTLGRGGIQRKCRICRATLESPGRIALLRDWLLMFGECWRIEIHDLGKSRCREICSSK